MVMLPMAQSWEMERPLNLLISVAAITSARSCSWAVPATSARIAALLAGICASGCTSSARARSNGAAVGSVAAGSSSIHCTRSRRNSATAAGRQIGQQLQDPVGAALEHPVEELVAGSHGGRRAAVQICTGCTKPCTDAEGPATSSTRAAAQVRAAARAGPDGCGASLAGGGWVGCSGWGGLAAPGEVTPGASGHCSLLGHWRHQMWCGGA